MIEQSKFIELLDEKGKPIKIEFVFKRYIEQFNSTYIFYKKVKSNLINVSKFNKEQNKLCAIKTDIEYDVLDEVLMQFIKENKKI